MQHLDWTATGSFFQLISEFHVLTMPLTCCSANTHMLSLMNIFARPLVCLCVPCMSAAVVIVMQGAHNTTGIVWYERQGWQQLYGISNTADAACDQLQAAATAAPGATAPPQPFFCTWFGIQCRDSVFNSSCSTPAGSYGISKIEIVNNNLSGNLSSKAFLAPLQLLHDCGLRQLVIGGGYGELRGELGPEWGRLSQLRGLSIFTTNLTGTLPPEIGKLTGAGLMAACRGGGQQAACLVQPRAGNVSRCLTAGACASRCPALCWPMGPSIAVFGPLWQQLLQHKQQPQQMSDSQ